MSEIWPKYLTDVGLNYFAQWAKENLGLKPDQLDEMVLAMHPVGSYYWSSEPTSPAELFGGTWTQITNGALLYATTNTNTGGQSSVTLGSSHLPSHTHSFSGTHSHSTGSHSHSFSGHTHTSTGTHSHSSFTHGGHTTSNGQWSFYPMQRIYAKSGASNVPNGELSRKRTGTTQSSSPSYSFNSTSVATDNYSHNVNTSSGGNVTSNSASGNTSSASNITSTSINLNPPYVNAYCWYRTG